MVSFRWRTTARGRAKGYRRRTTVMGFKWRTLGKRTLVVGFKWQTVVGFQ